LRFSLPTGHVLDFQSDLLLHLPPPPGGGRRTSHISCTRAAKRDGSVFCTCSAPCQRCPERWRAACQREKTPRRLARSRCASQRACLPLVSAACACSMTCASLVAPAAPRLSLNSVFNRAPTLIALFHRLSGDLRFRLDWRAASIRTIFKSLIFQKRTASESSSD
jgi:hypothetical protein